MKNIFGTHHPFLKLSTFSLALILMTILIIGSSCSVQKKSSDSEEATVPSLPLPERNLDPDNPPHFVWILLDACRPDFGCYGNERPVSPTIDVLAQEGTLFENHYAQGLWTMLSVPSYMAGRYFPVSCLDFMNQESSPNCPREIPDDERLIPEIMAENGYHTAVVSSQPFITPRSRLYKAFHDKFALFPTQGEAYVDFDGLLKPILEKIGEERDKPLFLYVHAMDTHFPHDLKPPYDRWINKKYKSKLIGGGEPVTIRGNQFTKDDQTLLRAMHDGSIKLADDAIAKIFNALKEHGLYENTVIIIGADHGDALGEDGSIWGHVSSSNEVSHVPLILAGPGIAAGQKISQLTQNVDIMATLIDLLNLDTTVRHHGKSLLPLIHGQESQHHEYVFTRWTTRNYDRPNGYIIRNEAYVYEYNPIDGYEGLFQAPDLLKCKVEQQIKDPEILDRFRKVRKEKFEPIWQEYDALQKLYYDFGFSEEILSKMDSSPSWISAPGDFPETDEIFENKWVLFKKFLWAAPWRGDPGPVTLSVTVPPERYVLTLYIYAGEPLLGYPVSEVRYQIQGEEEIVKIGQSGKDKPILALIDATTVDIPDGEFTITFYPSDKNMAHPVFAYLCFYPTSFIFASCNASIFNLKNSISRKP